MVYILLGLALILVLFLYFKYFKKIRCGNMVCITGGIKTGKSMLAVRQSLQLLKSQRRKVWFYNHVFRYLLIPFRGFKLSPEKERPQLYSNIPLSVPYIPITQDFLERKERPIYGSVAYICEASLVADSMSYKNTLVNEELLLFNKLWGHSSKGGYLIYDTQSISDNHYAVKRCLNSYLYIHHMIKGLFFCYLWIREERYSEDKQTVNSYDSDVENELKLHIVPKSVWRKYDCYCYSALTDDLPVKDRFSVVYNSRVLKAFDIVSFKHYFTLGGSKDEKKS